MSAYGYDRAVREEMRRIRKRRRDHPLWVKALARIVTFTVIWLAGAIALHILVPTGANLDFPAPPAQGRTTDVTSSLPPHPAMPSRHP